MDEAQLRAWLAERGVSEELSKSIVDTADQIKELYRESVQIGAALNHEDWLYEISTTGHESSPDSERVGWFLLGMCSAAIAFAEAVE